MGYKAYNKKWKAIQQQRQDINKNLLWKLVRQRYQLCFSICKPCSQLLFEAKNSNFLVESEGGVRANFWLCNDCAERNMRISDAYSQRADKGEQKRRQRAAGEEEEEEDRSVKGKRKRFSKQYEQQESGSEEEEE